jgi:transcriptional regulator with XRE-family HTH domain
MKKSPVSKRIKEARLAANLTQKKLGMMAGMSQGAASGRMNHYEKGRHAPEFETLCGIAKALKLPLPYFYADSDELAEWIKSFKKK